MSAPAPAPKPKPPEHWFCLQRKGSTLWSLVTETRHLGKTTRSENEPDSKAAQLGRLMAHLRRDDL